MTPKVEVLSIPALGLGEGPHWDVPTQSLYFVDIFASAVYKYTPSTGSHQKVVLGDEPIGFVIPVKNSPGTFVCGQGIKITLFTWDFDSNKITSSEVLASLPEPLSNRINDAKCDASGRLWLGTMAGGDEFVPKVGSFYSYSKKEGLKKHQSEITISNGIAYNSKNDLMYYIDSIKKNIGEYKFDLKAGTMAPTKIAYAFEETDGLPDGMTIDSNNKLWTACFTGAQVINVDPNTQSVISSVKIGTANQITSVAFGGPNLDELYVTSAQLKKNQFDLTKYPESGRLFKVTNIGAKGVPAFDFDLNA